MLSYWRAVGARQGREGTVSPFWIAVCAALFFHSIASLPTHHYHNGVPHTHGFGAYAHDHNALPLHLHEGHTHAHGRTGVHSHAPGDTHAHAPETGEEALRNSGPAPGRTQEERGARHSAAPASHFCPQSASGVFPDASDLPHPVLAPRQTHTGQGARAQSQIALSYDNRAPPLLLS